MAATKTGDSPTVAERNKKARSDALRDYLSGKKIVEQVFDLSEKLSAGNLESSEIQAIEKAANIKLKLVNKYLPDLKSIEHTGDRDNPIETNNKFTVEVVNAKPTDNG